MAEQWQTTLAHDVRYIRNRMEGSSWFWDLMQTGLLLAILLNLTMN